VATEKGRRALGATAEMIFGGSEQQMKKLITLLSICTTVAILALPAAAHNAIAQDQCSTEGKNALYKTFLDNRKTEQDKAYDAAKKYLACPAPAEVDAAQQAIIDYLKKFVGQYEDATKKIRFRTLLYNDKKYPEAYALGKEILAAEPDNLKVLVDLGANGYLVGPLNNASLSGEALEYAKKALQQLEAGKTIDDWQPLASKDVAVAYLNYTVGALSLATDPSNALKNLIKAAQFETPLKKSPFTYAYIAGAYETGPYAKQSEAYKVCCAGKDETPESKLALANIHQLVDRISLRRSAAQRYIHRRPQLPRQRRRPRRRVLPQREQHRQMQHQRALRRVEPLRFLELLPVRLHQRRRLGRRLTGRGPLVDRFRQLDDPRVLPVPRRPAGGAVFPGPS